MKKFVISIELSKLNFDKNVELVTNSISFIDAKDFPIKEVQDNIRQYISQVCSFDFNSIIKVSKTDWIIDEDYINASFYRISRSLHLGFMIDYDNSTDVWYLVHGRIQRVSVKVKELKDDDCMIVSPLLSHDLYCLNQESTINLLDNLWKVTQLYEINKRKEDPLNPLTQSPYTNQDWDDHLATLWTKKYQKTTNSYDHDVISYYFNAEYLDYNDYDMNNGEVIEYTLLDYAQNKQLESNLLAVLVRSETDMQDLFS